MILILAAATLISVLMGEGTEAITIIIIVLMNAAMGFFQEYRTEKTLEALKELSAPTARVRRGGVEKSVSARTVVPGDLLVLEAGDKIAADCVLKSGTRLACNESMLTGESLPVEKKEGDKLFMGCIVTEGRGEALVTSTGMATEMGKIAGLMQEASEDPTPLQRKLKQLGGFVAAACILICLAVAFLDVYKRQVLYFRQLQTDAAAVRFQRNRQRDGHHRRSVSGYAFYGGAGDHCGCFRSDQLLRQRRCTGF